MRVCGAMAPGSAFARTSDLSAPAAVRIRSATPADIGLVRDLAVAIWRDYYPAIISRDQIEYMLATMYDAGRLRDEMASGVVWELAFVESDAGVPGGGDGPCGYLSHAHDQESRVFHLHKLYVLPRLHGRGLGQRLIAHVKDAARTQGAQQVRLQVNKGNVRAIRAYERAAFRIVDSVVGDIGGGFVMDDYIMACPL
jgi:diamine N-acetyltransferase